jgi:hypothetical protein
MLQQQHVMLLLICHLVSQVCAVVTAELLGTSILLRDILVLNFIVGLEGQNGTDYIMRITPVNVVLGEPLTWEHRKTSICSVSHMLHPQ